MAQRAGVDILTRAPLDRPIEDAQAAELVAAGTVIVPTLTMMQGIVDNLAAKGIPGPAYELARASVAALHAAGMPAAPASPRVRRDAVRAFGRNTQDRVNRC